jgi:uncharacterized membrane protein
LDGHAGKARPAFLAGAAKSAPYGVSFTGANESVVDPGGALDGHAGKARPAFLAGAAKSAPYGLSFTGANES